MIIAERGTRGRIEQYFDLKIPILVNLRMEGAATYDFCCFAVDKDNKLSDDRYMIFYNQLSSPNGEIIGKEISSGMEFIIQLDKLPLTIQKLIFTVSIDGAGVMSEISRHKIQIGDQISANFSGNDFAQEKAVTSLEFYRKNGEWRFNFVARGFNGGLDALLAFYGGENADEAPAQNNFPPEPPKKISLEKKIQDGAPKLISLVKPLKIELEKRNLFDITAKVVLAVEVSHKMNRYYLNGILQEIVNKILPLAIQFDNNSELDLWYYINKCQCRPSVNMKNYETAIVDEPFRNGYLIGLSFSTKTEEVIMKELVEKYKISNVPVYIVFITSGDIYSTKEITKILIDSSYFPIFWQFVGIGGSKYGVLEYLDTMSGRYVDNANFFALDDFRSVPNEELYSRLLNEFPAWLNAIQNNGVLDGSAKNLLI